MEIQQWENLSIKELLGLCRWVLDQDLAELVKTCKKGLKELAISPAEFSSHGITASDHGNAPGEGRSALLMSQQSPDFQSNFRSGESGDSTFPRASQTLWRKSKTANLGEFSISSIPIAPRQWGPAANINQFSYLLVLFFPESLFRNFLIFL